AAGELRIPFTSGILVGIGESEADRMASLEALAGFDHIQEGILQNYVPHRRYYGEGPADIAPEAAEAHWRAGIGDAPDHEPAARGRRRARRGGGALAGRLCVYPQYVDDGWLAPRVLEVVERRHATFARPRRHGELAPDAIARARDGWALTAEELTALFSDTRP